MIQQYFIDNPLTRLFLLPYTFSRLSNPLVWVLAFACFIVFRKRLETALRAGIAAGVIAGPRPRRRRNAAAHVAPAGRTPALTGARE